MQEMKQQINIELDEKAAEGIYVNLAMIVHSPTEIVIDFARIMPRMPKAKVLEDNLKKFENQYGEIKLYGGKDSASNIGFESREENK